MADDNSQVSAPSGEPELPTPTFSDRADSSPSANADEIVSKVLAKLEPLIDKKVQSTKDKRFSEIEKALGGRSQMLAELENEGVTIPKEVRAEMRIRELEERLNQSPSQPVPQSVDGSTQQRTAVTEAIGQLKQYGLDTNDPDFIALLRGSYANRLEFDNKVMAHIVGKLAPSKEASPAGFVQSPATSQGQTSDLSKKVDRLAEMQKAPTKYWKEIRELEAELEKGGWKTS